MKAIENKKILVVDSSDSIRKSISKIIKGNKGIVFEAGEGDTALDIVLSEDIDLVITETVLPQLNGLELCKKIKGNEEKKHIPVIFLSTNSSDSDIEKGFEVGASAYISKLEGLSKLTETASEVIRNETFKKERLILVVDDSTSLLQLIKTSLVAAGFNVVTCENGLEALDTLKTIKPDLILSDIIMPEIDGITLCRRVKGDLNLKSIPFVVMSTKSNRQVMRRILQYGAAAYLIKPFNIEQLIITIDKILSDQFLLILKDRERLQSEQQMMLSSITSLISALEARDLYTKGHSLSVAQIVEKMANLLNVDMEDFESLMIGARLHDLGKIGVVDRVLMKPGRLTSEEFAIIKKHPSVGAQILKPIESFEAKIIPIVKYHHEKMDGSGYPEGLKGGEIPFWARLTAVADVFDALTSDRPYRPAMKKEKAFQIIDESKGTHLCSECVDIFFKCGF